MTVESLGPALTPPQYYSFVEQQWFFSKMQDLLHDRTRALSAVLHCAAFLRDLERGRFFTKHTVSVTGSLGSEHAS